MNVALRPDPLNILSICTGGAGLDLGVELAIPDARTICMVEREAFACAQLVSAMEAGHMAPAPIWSDARTFDGRAWRGAVDGLIGGIPCQPHSLAGRKQGSNDARDLWSTARRIIVQSRAWFVVIENVGGMLSAGSDEIAGAQRVFRDLHKLGFQVEGGLFTASEVGASHQRERIFIVGVLDDSAGRRERRNRGSVSGSADANGSGRSNGRQRDTEHPSEGVSGVGLADAYSERLERIRTNDRAQGRADAGRSAGLCDGAVLVHPERPERRPHIVSGHEPDRDNQRGDKATGRAGEPSQLVEHATGHGRREGRTEPSLRSGRPTPSQPVGLFPPGPDQRDAWREILDRSPELEPAFRRVADGLASRLDIARVDRLRMLGNGVVPLQAAYALRTLGTRLAARGSAGAARLVRMMEGIEE